MRGVMPGYIQYYFKDGQLPTHTKPSFREYSILTVQNIILKNILIFMYKIHNFPNTLPISIQCIIPDTAPIPGSTHTECEAWLHEYSEETYYVKSILYEGPRFYGDVLEINIIHNPYIISIRRKRLISS